MTKIRTIALVTIAALSLSACMSESALDNDTPTDVIVITHTGKGTLYWQ